jgi:hypothetical protein
VESQSPAIFLLAFGFSCAGLCLCPLMPARGVPECCWPVNRRFMTARDCLRLAIRGQAKSVRRLSGPCTRHSQLFHKHQNCATRQTFPRKVFCFHRERQLAGIFLYRKRFPRFATTIFPCGKEFKSKKIFLLSGSRDDRIRKFQSGLRR